MDSEIKKYFDSLKIKDWVFYASSNKNSGQAKILEVKNIKTQQIGVFRVLKGTPNDLDVQRFIRELKILTDKKYKHKNIINILEFSKNPTEYWYISEKGGDFSDYWNEFKNSLSNDPDEIVNSAINILLKILDGLSILHSEGIVHRDIKPQNIVIVNDEPVLIDFGLAFEQNIERISPVNETVGNRACSPDQLMYRMDKVLPWLDIFEISQVFIWMIMEKPAKYWPRPLDWRWVIYPSSLSEYSLVSIRAITAVCSNPVLIPQNASEMKTLILNLFTESKTKELDSNIDAIIESIKYGRAKSIITGTDDVSIFIEGFPMVQKICLELKDFLQKLDINEQQGITIRFKNNNLLSEEPGHDLFSSDFIQKIESSKKLGSLNFLPFDIKCSDSHGNFFTVGIRCHYYAPSEYPEYLNSFIPFSLEIETTLSNHGYANGISSLFKINHQGNLVDVNGVVVSKETFFHKIRNMIYDPKAWEVIQV